MLDEITVTATRPGTINTQPTAAGRQPRGIVKVNGTALPGWLEWEFDNNLNYQADTFRVTFAGQALPAAQNVAWLTDQGDLSVEILAGFPKDPNAPTDTELQSFIIGRVDDVLYDPVQNTVELSGRDYTSQFIDAKTTELFQNQTTFQIVKTLAARHNMTAVISADISDDKVGTFYQINNARLTSEHTEWDLLTWLAQEAQCSVWVSGTTLNFYPVPDASTASAYVIQWTPPSATNASPQSNTVDLKFARNLTLTKDVKVVIRTWNQIQKQAFTVTATASKNKSSVTRNQTIPYGQAQLYSYTIPNLTRQAALEKAQALLANISKHEMRMDADLPGDNLLTTRVLVSVQGTGTPFDQVYYPDSVIRSMSRQDGYRMKLAAKNHSPQSTVAL